MCKTHGELTSAAYITTSAMCANQKLQAAACTCTQVTGSGRGC